MSCAKHSPHNRILLNQTTLIPSQTYLFFAPRRKARQVRKKKEFFKNITAEAQRAQRNSFFCLSGDDDKQKHTSSKDWVFCPIVVSRLGKNSYLSVLRVSAVSFSMESLSASICVNLWLVAPNALCSGGPWTDSVRQRHSNTTLSSTSPLWIG